VEAEGVAAGGVGKAVGFGYAGYSPGRVAAQSIGDAVGKIVSLAGFVATGVEVVPAASRDQIIVPTE
jgi:hypothetical protein